MRQLKRNQREFWYALYLGMQEAVDEEGNYTGEPAEIKYSEPKKVKGNISPAKGTADQEVFGISLDYTKSISTTNISLEIDENSRIWIESEPILKEDGSVDGDSADYSVVQVAKGIYSTMYAIKSRKKAGVDNG